MRVRCRAGCGGQGNFGTAWAAAWRCSGRFPERGPRPAQGSCTVPARIIRRGAANLRAANVVSALTIPPIASRLHNILQDSRRMAFCTTLIGLNLLTEANFRQGLGRIMPAISVAVLQFLQSRPWADIQQAINDVTA